jgi:MFS family permease
MTSLSHSTGSFVSARRAFATLAVLTLITCVSYMDRVMLGALAPLVKAEFALSDTELGLLTGFAFTLFYAVCGIPLARYADRGSRRALISVSLAVWSAMTAACGLAQNYFQLLVARFAVGVGEAGSAPASFSLISDLYPSQRRPMAFGVYLSGTMLGIVLGLALAGWLGVRYGWRWAFYLLGLPGLLLALVAYRFIAEPPRGAFDVQRGAAVTSVDTRTALTLLAANRPLVWLTLGNGLQAFSVLGMSQWLPSFFVRTHKLSLGTIALFFGVAFGFGMLLGQIVGGLFGSRLARRNPTTLTVSIAASVAVAPCYILALWLPNARGAIAMTFVAAFVGALINPSAAAAGQTLVEPHLRATAQAVINLAVSFVGMGLGVLFVGMLSDALRPTLKEDSLRYALTIAQVMTLLAALCFAAASRATLESGDQIGRMQPVARLSGPLRREK